MACATRAVSQYSGWLSCLYPLVSLYSLLLNIHKHSLLPLCAVKACFLVSTYFYFMCNCSIGILASGQPRAVCCMVTICQFPLCIRSVCLSAQFQWKICQRRVSFKLIPLVKMLDSVSKVKPFKKGCLEIEITS